MVFKNCKSIHTFWMRYSIDAVFLDKNNYVLEIINNIKPFRITPFFNEACYTIEFIAGTVKKNRIKRGDLVYFKTLC